MEQVDLRDPSTWIDGKLTQQLKDAIVKFRPFQEKDIVFPYSEIDGANRKFSTFHYIRKLAYCEIIERHWLICSKSCDRVFCFCCKLFEYSGMRQSLLSTEGTSNWKNLSEILITHEQSNSNLNSIQKCMELKMVISHNCTIDKAHQTAIEKEKQHWREAMIRIIAAIHFLAKHHDALR